MDGGKGGGSEAAATSALADPLALLPDARGGPGGGGGLKPNFDPIILEVLTPPFAFSSSSPHRATTPRNPPPSGDAEGGDEADVPVQYENDDGGLEEVADEGPGNAISGFYPFMNSKSIPAEEGDLLVPLLVSS